MEYYKFLRQYVGHQPIQLVGAGVLIYKNNKILLQRRTDNRTYGKHGGVVDLYESTEECARRELTEEIGVKVGKLTLLGVYSGREMTVEYMNGDIANYVDIVYITDELLNEPSPDNYETDGVEWFDIDALPDNINKNDREPINDLVKYLKERQSCSKN